MYRAYCFPRVRLHHAREPLDGRWKALHLAGGSGVEDSSQVLLVALVRGVTLNESVNKRGKLVRGEHTAGGQPD